MAASLPLAILVVLLCAVVGRACARAVGPQSPWLQPAVGLAVLIVVSQTAIRLPGHGVTAAVVLVLLVAGAIVVLRDELRRWPAAVLDALPTAGIAFLAVMVPFVARGLIGVPGVGLNDDFAGHADWTRLLRQWHGDPFATIQRGYPVGTHTFVAALSQVTRAPEDIAFLALLIALPVLLALTARSALDPLPGWLRPLAATVVALPYAIASYYGQGLWKELQAALFVLAFTLVLRELLARAAPPIRAVIPLGLIAAAFVLTYGYPSAAWTAGIGGVLLGIALARRLLAGKSFPLAGGAQAVALVVAVTVLGFLTDITREFSFNASKISIGGGTHEVAGGNFISQISGFELFGMWWTPDFRLQPTNPFHQGLLTAFALLVIALGAVLLVQAGELMLPAAAATAVAIYLALRHREIPYTSAKALVVAAPLVVLVAVRGALGRPPPGRARMLAYPASMTLGLVFLALSAWSAGIALRATPVGGRARHDELRSIGKQLAGKRVLFLGHDNWQTYDLAPARVSTFFGYLVPSDVALPQTDNPGKPPDRYGQLDLDDLASATLDRFDAAVLPRSAFVSAPPRNWRLVRTTRSFEVLRRTGPTSPRRTLAEGGNPGATLQCPGGRPPAGLRGTAVVRPAPVVLPPPGFAPGTRERLRQIVSPVLPAGRWELSLQYQSQTELSVHAANLQAKLPARLGEFGSYYRAGDVVVRTPAAVTVAVRTAALAGWAIERPAQVGQIALVRTDVATQRVPVHAACGKYVDSIELP